MPRCLGRIRPSKARLSGLPQLAAIAPQLPEPPASVKYGGDAIYRGMLGNDRCGDCTVAGKYHLIQGWGADTNRPVLASDTQVIDEYSRLSGYNPSTGRNDTGMDETVVLDDWKAHGTPMPDGSLNKLLGYSVIQPANVVHIKQSIWCFGACYLGLSLPRSAEEQSDAGEPWTIPWFSPIEGGHCVVSGEYDESYLYVSTWGSRQPVAWDFVQRYFDAAYGLVNPLFLVDGKSPGGLDMAALTVDLSAVAD